MPHIVVLTITRGVCCHGGETRCLLCQMPINQKWEIHEELSMAGDVLAARRMQHLTISAEKKNLPYSVTPMYKPIL